MEYIFWILLFIIIYSYLVYPIFLFICNIPKWIINKKQVNKDYEPLITMFVAAYNEQDFIKQKIENTLSLEYPKEKIQYIWVTDGSTDKTPDILKEYTDFVVLHSNKRNGKTGAINRGMKYVKTPIVIFSDANTILNKDAILQLVSYFKNPKVGCVAGEKRITPMNKDNAVNSGEGIYWLYESFLKKNESMFNSVLGAVGELFAIRADLFEPIEADTILDDFIISLRIAQKGYKIKYAPKAYASERASANISEELKRKNRIAFGGFQSIARLKPLLNPFKNPILSFQYISHKLLRWILVPLSMFLIFFVNIYLAFKQQWQGDWFYFMCIQLLFYFFVFLGYLFQSRKTKFKILFVPYYVFIMNFSEVLGFFRYLKKQQSVNWEKAQRG